MRFQPDTWAEMVLRPIAMAAADANVYVEIMAPDFRFVFALALSVAVLAILLLRRKQGDAAGGPASPRPRAVLVLLAALALAFVPWLATTGNGRYFLVGLLMVGPVCVGLACLLPVTKAMRLAIVAGMVLLQAFAVQQSAPLRAWELAAWAEPPYVHVDLGTEVNAAPATYVTLSAISYSAIAPKLHPQSRWISLHNAPPPDSGAHDASRTAAFLASAEKGRIVLLAPVVAGSLTADRLPNADVAKAMEGQLAPYRLAFAQPQSCRFLASRTLAQMGLGEKTEEQRARSGFWLCELVRVAPGVPAEGSRGRRHDDVFKALELQCPRFFPAGGDGASLAIRSGEMRSYHRAEMKAYVYDTGEVYYKYHRALNAERVGLAPDVVAGRSRIDCDNIRGRSGLPWNRGF
ncbi:hypothetical protein WG902_05685 [Ramlibacter sp. PS3R-8]|uniref:hypothetical protein n=1 Tax=Ramlibacter sp. PS3R-8 TaxID=3133437 RepID=UPI00309C05DF